MHAVFFQRPSTGKSVVCLVNEFGWFRSQPEPPATASSRKAPAPCTDVVIEVAGARTASWRALEAVTGTELVVRHENGRARILVPEFPVMACVVIERGREHAEN